uniref:Dystrotelin n=1 Tax=Xiphophorus couchianus TaxID=32473 RepID=A0A3B5LR51_9TELE
MTEARLSIYRTAMKVRSLQRCRPGLCRPLWSLCLQTACWPNTGVSIYQNTDMNQNHPEPNGPGWFWLCPAGLVRLSGDGSGSVTRSALSSLLQDLSKVPAAVQEQEVFGSVEAAVTSCFNQGGAPAVSQSHLLSWLKSEPRLLLWLPTLYRLSASQKVSHAVRCHTCKAFPIAGLRYRCRKCVNVQVCQDCFLDGRQTRKHKTHHPVVEFCTQPTWRESLSSLVHNARHALLPRRHTHREADRTSVLTAPPTSDAATLPAASARSSSCDEEEARDAAVQASPPLSSSKSLQTDEAPPPQQVRWLQVTRHYTQAVLLEQQLGAWRLTVQSDQGILEDRCSEMEVTMETMRQHNERLQDMLNQVAVTSSWGTGASWEKMEAQQHASNTDHTKGGTATPTSDPPTDDEEEEELMKDGDEWSLNEPQTPSPTIPHKSSLSHDEQEEGPPEDRQPIGRQESLKDRQHGDPEEAGLQRNVNRLSDAEDSGTCSPEVLLQQTVDRLKTEMDGMRDRNTGETQMIR